MPKPKRKYESETIEVPTLGLESISSKIKKTKSGRVSRKKAEERGLSQELISGLIEKIKDI
jgi:hypothetical protein